MAQEVCVFVTAEDRAQLRAIVGDRNRPLKHVQRARIILASADRLPVLAVAREVEVSRPAVWRWQRRFAEEGVEGLLHDKTQPPGKTPHPSIPAQKPRPREPAGVHRTPALGPRFRHTRRPDYP